MERHLASRKEKMTKTKAIKKLHKSTKGSFSVQVEATTSGQNNVQAAKALIQILGKKEDGTSLVLRYSNAYGFGATLKEAQDSAVVDAIENLGL